MTIISGHTGCDKTTQIPQYLLHNSAHGRRPVNIIVTQPRRIAAISIATRVAKEMRVPLGTVVGYKVGLDKEHASSETRLTYVTTGILKKMIISKRTVQVAGIKRGESWLFFLNLPNIFFRQKACLLYTSPSPRD